MPCLVPTCDSNGVTLKPFPNVAMLAERWLEAIHLGCGLVIEVVNDQDHLEICDAHFPPLGNSKLDGCRYREPSRFANCDGSYVDVSSCRLCLGFYHKTAMVMPKSTSSEKRLVSNIYELFNIDLQHDDLLTLICQECLVRIEILSTIKQKITETDRAYQQLVRIGQEHILAHTVKIEPDPFPDEIIKEEALSEDLFDPEPYVEDNSSDEWKPDESEISSKVQKSQPKRGVKRTKREQKKEPRVKHEKKKESVVENVKRKCYICKTFLADANELVSHLIENHTSEKVYRCEECSLDIPVLTMYNRHLSRHDETERPIKCSDCPLRFVSPLQCKNHENIIHGAKHNIKLGKHREREIICEMCGEKFPQKGRLKDHIQKVHLKIGIPKCDKCDKTFTTTHSLERHMLLHTNVKPYSCDQCDMTFRRLLDMRRHKSVVHDGINPYVCADCGKEFRGYQALYWHRQKTHLGKADARSAAKRTSYLYDICKLCDARFGKMTELVEHIKQDHSDIDYPLIKCAECPQTFFTPQHLSKHKSIHTDKYACALCGTRHCNTYQLQCHIDSKHPDGRTFECPTCGKQYKTTRALTIHIALHTKPRRFQCEYCQKAFARNCELIIHTRIHTGEKPFECVGCLKRFSDDGTFHKHKKKCQVLKTVSEQTASTDEED
ncbi:zinc finger protein ZFP2-like [Topomyia yanbarensis]|uniref:zinc finger protein ZFP2-like n=1 Tax=Topomyia yanbarensis TaxID=2498891 RepID=UPI00273B8614|nr:zinc finger protein ZFP2-like [Topomyia yanbarensis]